MSAVLGKVYFRWEDLGADCLTFDGKIFHAPEGAAGCFVKNSLSLPSLQNGNIPFPLLAGLTLAADEAAHYFDHLCTETARLRDKLEEEVVNMHPEAVVLFKSAERLPNCSAIAFPGVASEALLFLLEKSGVYASRGTKPLLAETLIQAGVNPLLAEGAVSFVLSRETTEEEIVCAAVRIAEAAKTLRQYSRALI